MTLALPGHILPVTSKNDRKKGRLAPANGDVHAGVKHLPETLRPAAKDQL